MFVNKDIQQQAVLMIFQSNITDLSSLGTEGGLHGHVAHPGQVPLAHPVEALVPGLGPVQEGVQHHEGAGREVLLDRRHPQYSG